MMNSAKTYLRNRFRSVHSDEGGAVALVCLASILVILMMAMVFYDSVVSTSEKIHVQTATDASAYSETSVRARTMNMIALTNVGKRMTIANYTAYINIKQWITAIKHYSYIIGAICTLVTAGGCAGAAAQIAAGVTQVDWQETRDSNKIFRKRSKRCMLRLPWPVGCVARWPDWMEWAAPDYDGIGSVIEGITTFGGRIPWPLPSAVTKIIDKVASIPDDIWRRWDPQVLTNEFYGPELRAFDNYQVYMLNVAPYWAWTEGIMKGLANRAPVTVSYPSPVSEPHKASLPLERAEWVEQCDRAHDRDKWYIFADVVLKQLGAVISGGSGEGGFSKGSLLTDAARYGSVLLAGLFMALIGKTVTQPLDLFAPRTFHETCEDIVSRLLRRGGSFDIAGRPHLLKRYNAEADWLMDASSITFGMRPNADKMSEDGARKRYGFLNPDYQSFQPRAGATWTLSRGEIVHKTDDPNMWAAEWSARIRPVALSGEWEEVSASNFDLAKAFNEILPQITWVNGVAHGVDAAGIDIITHPYSLSSGAGAAQIFSEIAAIEMGVNALDNESMGGISK